MTRRNTPEDTVVPTEISALLQPNAASSGAMNAPSE